MQKTIDTFLGKLKADGRSPNTVCAYRADLHGLHTFLQGSSPPINRWQDVTEVHLARYLAHLTEAGRSPSTLNRKSVVLGRFFDFAGRALPNLENLIIQTHPIRPTHQPPAVLDPTEIATLLSYAARSPARTARRDQALLELLWDTGALVSEVTNLNIGDFYPANGTIVLNTGSARQRTLPLRLPTVTAIADYLSHEIRPTDAHRPDDALLQNQQGGRLTRQGVWLIVRSCAQAAGIESPVTPRLFRRAAAMHLFQIGTDQQSIQERLGVANLSNHQTMPRLLLDGAVPTISTP